MIFSTIKGVYIKSFCLFLITFTVSAQTIKIKIIETSDVHGAILPYDLVNDTTTTSSLAQVYSYVNMERNLSGQNVVLLDNVVWRHFSPDGDPILKVTGIWGTVFVGGTVIHVA